MFVGKAGAYVTEEPFRYSTLGWAPVQTGLERFAKDKEPLVTF